MSRAKTPGLNWKTQRDGSQIAYWCARRDLIKAGYRPKNVRLHYAPDDPMLVARCHALQAEMIEWETDSGRRPVLYDGTVKSAVRVYESHQDSPYRDLTQHVQAIYSRTLKGLVKHKGDKRIDALTGNDIKRWYKEWIAAGYSVNTAYYIVAVFKSAIKFLSTLRIKEATTLRAEMGAAQFHRGSRRTQQLTYDQARAFRNKAHDLGIHYMARCIVLQFDFALRRRDVIGEYITDETAEAAIRIGKRIWHDGLTWGDRDADGIVRRVVSKTRRTSNVAVAHAIADYPMVEAELALTSRDKQTGPLVIHDKTGVPPTEAQCRADFRKIARACGIPDDVKMMDARAGADTETYEAGATTEEAMALLGHTEVKTNRGYLREVTQQSRSAARKRVASRKEG